MKKISLIWVLCTIIFTLTSCGGGNDQSTTPAGDSLQTGENELPVKELNGKRYGIESGMVEYEFSGSQKGKETLYFVDWGLKEGKYTETEMTIMGITNKTSTVSIIDGDWIYNYDRITGKGTKMKNPLLAKLTDDQKKDIVEVGKEMMKQMGAEKTGNEDILGKSCEVWEVKSIGSKICVWNNVVMKTSMKMAGVEYSSVAVKLEEDASVEDKINFPDGVDKETFTDLSNIMDKVKKPQ